VEALRGDPLGQSLRALGQIGTVVAERHQAASCQFQIPVLSIRRYCDGSHVRHLPTAPGFAHEGRRP
jgi:hypothetical protein